MKRSIGIDAHCLNEQLTGVATYVSNLVRTLGESHQKENITLFTQGPISIDNPFQLRIIPKRPLWTSLWLPLSFIRKRPPEVMLYPSHVLPVYSPSINVVTIHDVAFELFPEYFTKTDLKRLTQLTRYSVRHADHLLADSQSTKDDVIRIYGIPEEKIAVVRLGYDKDHFKPASPDEIQKVREKYQLQKPYILAVGTLQKRKNHISLIRALRLLIDDGLNIELVISGAKGWYYEETMKEIDHLHLSEAVRFIGYADFADLPALNSGAIVGGLVSLYEGFGLPVLESLACHTPMVLSSVSSLPEVGGDAVLYVEPMDIPGIASALKRIITEPRLRDQLIARIPSHLAQFSWEKTAQQTLEILQSVERRNG